MNQTIYSQSQSEDEVARLLRRTDYAEFNRRMKEAVNDYKSWKIQLYEFGVRSRKILDECGWTSEEAGAYEREHGIYWNINR